MPSLFPIGAAPIGGTTASGYKPGSAGTGTGGSGFRWSIGCQCCKTARVAIFGSYAVPNSSFTSTISPRPSAVIALPNDSDFLGGSSPPNTPVKLFPPSYSIISGDVDWDQSAGYIFYIACSDYASLVTGNSFKGMLGRINPDGTHDQVLVSGSSSFYLGSTLCVDKANQKVYFPAWDGFKGTHLGNPTCDANSWLYSCDYNGGNLTVIRNDLSAFSAASLVQSLAVDPGAGYVFAIITRQQDAYGYNGRQSLCRMALDGTSLTELIYGPGTGTNGNITSYLNNYPAVCDCDTTNSKLAFLHSGGPGNFFAHVDYTGSNLEATWFTSPYNPVGGAFGAMEKFSLDPGGSLVYSGGPVNTYRETRPAYGTSNGSISNTTWQYANSGLWPQGNTVSGTAYGVPWGVSSG